MRCRPIIVPNSKILLIGEAPGAEEEKLGIPFVGYTGTALTKILTDAGIERSSCSITNVFMDRPFANQTSFFCTTKKLAEEEAKDMGWIYDLPPIKPGAYVKPYHCLELFRLQNEIIKVNPHLLIPLGNIALWAVCRTVQITKFRGSIQRSTLCYKKVLPTFHPSYFCRDWAARPVVLSDLMKAKIESDFPEIRRPKRRIFVPESIEDIKKFKDLYLDSCPLLSFDIETTVDRFITSIALAPSSGLVLVVPITRDTGRTFEPYWGEEDEKMVWELLDEILSNSVPKMAQNGLYDIQFLYDLGIQVRNYSHDTMLLHHALHPELRKGLAFQASVYTNEISWKTMRPRRKKGLKADE